MAGLPRRRVAAAGDDPVSNDDLEFDYFPVVGTEHKRRLDDRAVPPPGMCREPWRRTAGACQGSTRAAGGKCGHSTAAPHEN